MPNFAVLSTVAVRFLVKEVTHFLEMLTLSTSCVKKDSGSHRIVVQLRCQRANVSIILNWASLSQFSNSFAAACSPPCQNQGICIAPDQCSCPDQFSGPQCQFQNKPCLELPPMPHNSRRSCRTKQEYVFQINNYRRTVLMQY